MTTLLDADLLTVDEAAALVRVNQSTIRRWIRTGALPAYRVGQRYVRIRRDDLQQIVRPVETNVGQERRFGVRYAETDEEARRPLSEDERAHALKVLGEARRFREELLAKRNGVLFPPSWELINEARDERTEQL